MQYSAYARPSLRPAVRYDPGMHLLARAIITGFGFTLGAAVFRKVAKQLGFEDPMYAVVPRPDAPPPPVGEPQRQRS